MLREEGVQGEREGDRMHGESLGEVPKGRLVLNLPCKGRGLTGRPMGASEQGGGAKEMNVEQLKKNQGSEVRLRPIPGRREGVAGQALPSVDDTWTIYAVEKGKVELHNIRTGHFVKLGNDNVQEFRSPNFLMLRCQLTLVGAEVLLEPLSSGAASGRPYVSISMFADVGTNVDLINYASVFRNHGTVPAKLITVVGRVMWDGKVQAQGSQLAPKQIPSQLCVFPDGAQELTWGIFSPSWAPWPDSGFFRIETEAVYQGLSSGQLYETKLEVSFPRPFASAPMRYRDTVAMQTVKEEAT
jgi:hypothetical protein